MSLIATDKGGGNFTPVPEDQHVARCVMVVDIGHQTQIFQGETKQKHQVIIGWELPDCQQVFGESKGSEPSMMSGFYTLSLNEKANLRAMLQGWRGRAFTAEELSGFDITSVMSVPCLLQVIHDKKEGGNVRAKVQSVTKLPKGIECPPQVISSRLFTLAESSEEDFRQLPEWIQEKIKLSSDFSDWVRRVNTGPAAEPPAAEEYFNDTPPPEDETPF